MALYAQPGGWYPCFAWEDGEGEWVRVVRIDPGKPRKPTMVVAPTADASVAMQVAGLFFTADGRVVLRREGGVVGPGATGRVRVEHLEGLYWLSQLDVGAVVGPSLGVAAEAVPRAHLMGVAGAYLYRGALAVASSELEAPCFGHDLMAVHELSERGPLLDEAMNMLIREDMAR